MTRLGAWRAGTALAAALLAGAPAQAQAPSVVATRTIDLPAPPAIATHDLRLTVIHLHGTRWHMDTIAPALARAARLLGQCGIAVTGADVQEVDAPRPLRFYSTQRARALMNALEPPRPALVFVEETLMVPAFDAEAIGRGNARTRPELADTVWIAYGARDLGIVIAHELVHVLADSGAHSDAPGNLMREETSEANTRLDSGQCAVLLESGTKNGLITTRPTARQRN
jgi:hypothetical protein